MDSNSSRFELSYCEDIELTQGNILKATPQFMSMLEKEDQIQIEGEFEDQFIFSAGSHSFKMRGIFLPTTMLVTRQLGVQHPGDNSNSNQKQNKPASKVLLQTAKYLKIEPHQIQFDHIYTQISQLALSANLFQQNHTLEYLLQNEGITVSELKARYKLTNSHIEKIAAAIPMTFYPLDQQDNQILVIQLSYGLMAAVMRELMPVLTAQGLIGSYFTYSQIKESVNCIDIKILQIIARHFGFESSPPLTAPSLTPESFQGERQFKITLQSIIRFVVVQLLLLKREYVVQQMNQLLQNTLLTYLPVGLPQFSEEAAKQKISQIVSYYFLTVSKENRSMRIHYDPLQMDYQIKNRIQVISNYKKKFSKAQIQGLFGCWYNQKEIDDLLLKNFRKMGKQYEIKLLIPK